MRQIVIATAFSVLLVAGILSAHSQARPPNFCEKHPTHPSCITTPPPPPTGDPLSPNDCSVDVSAQLRNWINSSPNGAVLSFDANACYRIESVIEATGRSGLTFLGNGATLRSINAPDDQRAFFRFWTSTNLVFRNLTIDGSFVQDEANPIINDSLQHAHAIDLRGSSAEVDNVTMLDLAGDCVYFGLGGTTRSSGSVHDSTCRRVSRNGVAVVAGDDITIERVTTSGIGLTAFDIEPNEGGNNGSARVTVRSNSIGSYYLYAWALVFGPISDQSFTGNVSTAPKGLRIASIPFSSMRSQRVTIDGNTATNPTSSAAFQMMNVDTLTVTNNNVPTGTLLACTSVTNLTFSGNTPNTKDVGCP